MEHTTMPPTIPVEDDKPSGTEPQTRAPLLENENGARMGAKFRLGSHIIKKKNS